jgi:hypothetical protein
MAIVPNIFNIPGDRITIDPRITYDSVNPSGNQTDFLKVNDASDNGVLSSANQCNALR